MKKYIIRDREAGNVITWCDTLADAEQELREYEDQDKADNDYSPDFYEIVEIDTENLDREVLEAYYGSNNSSIEGRLNNGVMVYPTYADYQQTIPNTTDNDEIRRQWDALRTATVNGVTYHFKEL